jgi:hypothetical protein
MKQDLGLIEVGSANEQHNLETYRAVRSRSLHKMNPIPVFKK